MSKELFMEAHDELAVEYMEANPDATEEEAIEATADGAWERMANNMAAIGDSMRQRAKDGLL